MLRNLTLMVFFSISPLVAKSLTATPEADRKAQLSQYQRLDSSWNPDDFSAGDLSRMDPWMIGIDDHTITMSHKVSRDGQKLVINLRVPYPRNSFSLRCNLTRWSSVVHSNAKRVLFPDERPQSTGPMANPVMDATKE